MNGDSGAIIPQAFLRTQAQKRDALQVVFGKKEQEQIAPFLPFPLPR